MKLRKIRYVADTCPLHKRNCNTCKYGNGFENDKVYCYYKSKVWKKEGGEE